MHADIVTPQSFTVRVVSVEALAQLSSPGDPFVIEMMFKMMEDLSHLVRVAAINALQRIVQVLVSAIYLIAEDRAHVVLIEYDLRSHVSLHVVLATQ